MIPRLLPLVLALTLVAGVVTGCTPEPAPSPTATGFATEEEAFAAAEETYRAYVDALNEFRKDSDYVPNPQTYLTDQALEIDVETQRQLAEQSLRITGLTRVLTISPVTAEINAGGAETAIIVCLDSSNARVEDELGNDVTPSDRENVYALKVTLVGTADLVQIASSDLAGEVAC